MKVKKTYIRILIVTIIFITGCSVVKNNTSTINSSSQITESKPVDSKKITDLMQQIQSESGVWEINASRDNDTVIVDITLKSDADGKNAKELAKKYAKKFKDIYKTKKANINVLQNGKSIANFTTG